MEVDLADIERDCYPIVYLADVKESMNDTNIARLDTLLASEDTGWDDTPAYPCGLMAKSFFNGNLK